MGDKNRLKTLKKRIKSAKDLINRLKELAVGVQFEAKPEDLEIVLLSLTWAMKYWQMEVADLKMQQQK